MYRHKVWLDSTLAVSLLVSVAAVHSGHPAPPKRWLFTASYIKAPAGSIVGYAASINDSGTVLGDAQFQGPGGPDSFHYVPFMYSHGHARSLWLPKGACEAEVGSLTDTGFMAGDAGPCDGTPYPVIGRIRSGRAHWYRLRGPKGRRSTGWAYSINASGVAVGQLEHNSQALEWPPGRSRAVKLPLPRVDNRGGTDDIDDAGDVLGGASCIRRGQVCDSEVVVWPRNGSKPLKVLAPNGRTPITVQDIVSTGRSTALMDGSYSPDGTHGDSVVWSVSCLGPMESPRLGVFSDAGRLAGTNGVVVGGINRSGVMVGTYSGGPDSYNFIYYNGKLHNLDKLVPYGKGLEFEASGINNRGQILTSGLILNPTRRIGTPPVWTLFSNGFDCQRAGALAVGRYQDRFSTVTGKAEVVKEPSDQSHNSLRVTVQPGESSYATKRYRINLPKHSLSFAVRLGSAFKFRRRSYFVLAQTQPRGSGSPGKVELVVNAKHELFLTYWDHGGTQRYLYTSGHLGRARWHNLRLTENTGNKSLALTEDGKIVGQTTGLHLGRSGVGSFSLGNYYASSGPGPAGTLYIDNVSTTTQILPSR